MTPSQFWRCYSPGKIIEYPGHDVAFLAPINFNVEPAEIMSTQSPSESTVPSLITPDSHEHQSESAMVDLTMDHTTSDLFVDALLAMFDASATNLMRNAVDSRRKCRTSNLHWTICARIRRNKKTAWHQKKPNG